jgi:carboxyl-terminal processing protease
MFQRSSTKASIKALAGASVLGLLIASFFFGYGVGTSTPKGQDANFALLREAEQRIGTSALSKPAESTLLKGALKGMVEGINDPHAAYLNPESYRAFGDELANGRFSGVGVWLNLEGKNVKIVTVLPGSPADIAGIQPGDYINSVDGKPVKGLTLDDVANRIVGKPGTTVSLDVVRGTQQQHYELERRELDLPSVSSNVKGQVGTINIVSFSGGVGKKVRDAVGALEKKGAKGFVLDLRGNPGGSLDEAVDVASVFLDGGLVVSYRERDKPDVVYNSRGAPATSAPLVVVVDEGSASASEIVAGAIQDRHRGLIVGTETYKKGSVQQVFRLSDGSGIKLTVASYFTPSGRAIGERGVIPDVTVEQRDRQLPRADEILSGILAQSSGRAAG